MSSSPGSIDSADARRGGPRVRGAMAAVVALGLAVRMAFLAAERPWDPATEARVVLQGDAVAYHGLALALLDTGHLVTPTGQPESLRTPLYPMWVALWYGACGRHPWIPIAAQVVLDLVGLALTMRLAARVWGTRAGAGAGVLYALDPFLVLHASLLLSETLFIVLLLAAATAWVPLLSGGPWRVGNAAAARRALVAGGLLGLAIMTRPVARYLPLVLAALLLAGRGRRAAAMGALALLAGAALVVLPWAARNHRAFGGWAISTSGDYNLLVLDAAPIRAERTGAPVDAVTRDMLDAALRRALADPHGAGNPFALARAWRAEAMTELKRDPPRTARRFALGGIQAFGNLVTAGFAAALHLRPPEPPLHVSEPHGAGALVNAFVVRKSPAERAIGLVVALLLFAGYALAAIGLVVALAGRSARPYVAFVVVITLYFVALAGASGLARFRLPATPFDHTLGGLGAAALLERMNRRRG